MSWPTNGDQVVRSDVDREGGEGVAEGYFEILLCVYDLFVLPWINAGAPGGQLRNIGDSERGPGSEFLGFKYDPWWNEQLEQYKKADDTCRMYMMKNYQPKV